MRPRALPKSCAAVAIFGAAGALGAAGCKPPARPVVAALPAWTASVTAASSCSVRATAVDPDGRVVASLGHRGAITIAGAAIPDADGDTASVVALDPGGAKAAWTRSIHALAGPAPASGAGVASPGPVARAGALTVVAVGATGSIDLDGKPLPVRGTPGAIAIGLDAATGATRWAIGFGSTDWATITSIAGLPGGDVAIGGSFTGTLRAGGEVVTSGGASDGFVARLAPNGDVRWLVRVGGDGADGVAGVAAMGDRIAVAGTFTGEVDFRGAPLAPIKPDVPFADGFVASLGGDGRVAWARAFGSPADEQVAGVAVTAKGAIAIAATVRAVTYLGAGAASITAGGVEDWDGHGAADALVALWDASGEPIGSALLGGSDYDGARAIAARGDEIVVGGWFSGSVELAGQTFKAGGGDDAFVVVLDDKARPLLATALAGDGREDVTALAGAPSGWAAGLAFTTAATFADAHLAAPADPSGGCAIAFRPR